MGFAADSIWSDAVTRRPFRQSALPAFPPAIDSMAGFGCDEELPRLRPAVGILLTLPAFGPLQRFLQEPLHAFGRRSNAS
jgi:hypothetical protein